MSTSPYSRDALKGHFRVGDGGRWKVDLDTQLETIANSAAERAEQRPVVLGLSSRTDASGVVHRFAADIETDLILRATYRRLVKQYNILLPNRESIISGIIEAVSEGSPYAITRCDIRSFYESIDAKPIIKKIISDTRTDGSLRAVIEWLYDPGGGAVPPSVAPRGLAISTVLAELTLRNFDEYVRKMPGVHRYFRFADDMIIFHLPRYDILSEIQSLLSDLGLEVNEKTTVTHVKSEKPSAAKPDTKEDFDFLGYKFSANNSVRSFESREFNLSIAEVKLKKRQTRVYLALKSFQRHKDAPLLIDRLRYITSNHSIYRTKHSRGKPKQKVRTGIYYNYSRCGFYPASKRGRKKQDHPATELVALDGYLKTLLFGPTSEFSADILALAPHFLTELRKLSFAQGYRARIIRRHSRARVSEIFKVWNNE
ncbi:antiviral reverse transcriptase Drt3a [Mameliella sp.]|uniref:antiviral reverse transcriptase Drt3a n=1 Tax=Mameliella sp. TaxID=1924940 RepID=UPI003B500C08